MLADCSSIVVVTILFYASLDHERPWRKLRYYVVPVSAVYLVQVIVVFSYYPQVSQQRIESTGGRSMKLRVLLFCYSPQTNTFPLMGTVNFFIANVTILLALKYMKQALWHCRCDAYSRQLRVRQRWRRP